MMNDDSNSALARATFAGGCFWCVESDFKKLEGVHEAISGYVGGSEENPSYEQVCSGLTDHLEAVQVIYDPGVVSYERLLFSFWRQVDPTDDGGQYIDRGTQYSTAIFYHNATQKKVAEQSRKELAESGRFDSPIVTEIRELMQFWPAEDYHQNYDEKSPVRYSNYRIQSGRDQFCKRVWKD